MNFEDSLINKSSEVTNEKNISSEMDSTLNLSRYIISIRPSSNEITMIDENCGIFIPIDTMKMDKLKGKTQSELDRFYIVADDANTYSSNARDFISKMDLKIINSKTRYFEFKVSDSTIIIDSTPVYADGWGYTILYRKGEMPKLTYNIDIERSYRTYFKK